VPKRRLDEVRIRTKLGRAGLGVLPLVLLLCSLSCTKTPDPEWVAEPLEELIATFEGERNSWGVTTGAILDETVVVTSSFEPIVRVIGGTDLTAWGVEGNGPGEFRIGSGLVLDDSLIHALDFRVGGSKVHTFTKTGTLIRSRRLDYPFVMAMAGWDFGILIEFTQGLGRQRSVISLDGAFPDTLISMRDAELLTVAIGGAQASFRHPFASRPLWGASGGLILLWDGSSDQVAFIDRGGNRVGSVSIDGTEVRVTSKDQNDWLDSEVPNSDHEMSIRLRAGVMETVVFPQSHPLITAVKGDGQGGFMLLRSTKDQEETWQRVSLGGSESPFRLPKGRKALAFGTDRVLTLVRSHERGRLLETYLLR